jgi:cellulose synthase/poly-beta-1,6-N-acetylglucosamine synthase-like glycosyltransferase
MIYVLIFILIIITLFYFFNVYFNKTNNESFSNKNDESDNINGTDYINILDDDTPITNEINNSHNDNPMGEKVIWMYWETLPGKIKPGYIDLCMESVKFNCGKCFEVIVLDNNTILDYLPDLRDLDLSFLELPQRVDYYRYSLLEQYGGVWIDADILVLKCICPFYNKLKKHDYVGFGCGHEYDICQRTLHGYTKPLNWFMMSRPHTKFITCVKTTTEERILDSLKNNRQLEYHEIGKDVLEHCYRELSNDDDEWDYGHIPSRCQEYDSTGNVLDNIMIDFNWKDCEGKRVFFPLYNTAPGYPDWFKQLSPQELKEGDSYLRPIIDSAFENKPHCSYFSNDIDNGFERITEMIDIVNDGTETASKQVLNYALSGEPLGVPTELSKDASTDVSTDVSDDSLMDDPDKL